MRTKQSNENQRKQDWVEEIEGDHDGDCMSFRFQFPTNPTAITSSSITHPRHKSGTIHFFI